MNRQYSEMCAKHTLIPHYQLLAFCPKQFSIKPNIENFFLLRLDGKLLVVLLLFSYLQLSGQQAQLTVQLGHHTPINALEFSEDGQYLISASFDNTIKLWEVATGKELRTFVGYAKQTTGVSLDITADNQYIISAAHDGTIKIWHASKGTMIRQFKHQYPVNYVRFYDGYSRFVTADSEGIVQLWDTYKGQKLRTLKGHKGEVKTVIIHKSKQRLVSGGEDKTLKVWSLKTGKLMMTLKGHTGMINAIATSEDRYVISGGDDGTLRLWDIDDERMVQEFKGHKRPITAVNISPDNRYFVSGSIDNTMKLWTVNGEKPIFSKDNHTGFEHTLDVSNDYIVNATGNRINLFQLQNGNRVSRFKTPSEYKNLALNFSVAQFQSNNRGVLSSHGKTLGYWGAYLGKLFEHGNYIKDFEEKNKWIAVLNDEKELVIVDQSGQVHPKFLKPLSQINDFQFSLDGAWLATGGTSKKIQIWEMATGKLLHTLEGHTHSVFALTFDKKGKRLLSGDTQGNIFYWDVEQGELIQSYIGHQGIVTALCFMPDFNWFISGSEDGFIRFWNMDYETVDHEANVHKGGVWDLVYGAEGVIGLSHEMVTLWKGNRLIHKIEDLPTKVTSVHVDASKKQLLIGGYDNTILLYDIARTPKLLATLYTLDENDWSVVTPNGLFDATTGGMQKMHYVVGFESIELNQLKERYYEPNLLAKLLGISTEPIRDVTKMDRIALFPKMEVRLNAKRRVKLIVDLKSRGGGIGKTSVFINHKEVIENVLRSGRDATYEVNLSKYDAYFIEGKDNLIEVQTTNAEGWLQSRRAKLYYNKPVKKRKRRKDKRKGKKIVIQLEKKYEPKFYGIVVGTADYRGKQLDLAFADKDAKDIAHIFGQAASNFFQKSFVDIQLLHTADKNKLPTKANIQQTFQEIAQKAKPEDVLFIYFAGHGVNHGRPKTQFYYLTKDMESGDLSDATLRRTYAISSSELTNWIKAIPSQKQVMILDACASGKVVDDLLAKERSTMSSSQRRALERLKDRTGMFVLAGSAADKVSYEASQFGQGLLTYSLLQGVAGEALRQSEYIDVMQLFQFAADKVPQYAEFIGGVQRPVIATPLGSNSFDIGRVTDSMEITLAEVKPMFVRSNFQEEDSFTDILNIGDRLDKQFKELSASGKTAPIIFIDVKQHPQAYSIRGRYHLENKEVVLEGKVFKGKSMVGPFKLRGSQKDLTLITQKVLDAVQGVVSE